MQVPSCWYGQNSARRRRSRRQERPPGRRNREASQIREVALYLRAPSPSFPAAVAPILNFGPLPTVALPCAALWFAPHGGGMKIFRLVLLLAAIVLPVWAPSFAQEEQSSSTLLDMSLEDLMKVEVQSVYAASRQQQKVTEAPASITVITSDDIQKYGYRTLAEVLRSVRGFFVTYDRDYNYLGVRGFNRPGDYDTRVLLLIDGHRINDDVYDSALLGTEFPFDLDLVDRIEVIRGPNSSLYVASAFLGVINVVSKHGRLLGSPELSTEAGSFDSYKGRTSYGAAFKNGLEMLLSGSYYTSPGPHRLYFPEFDNPDSNNGIAVNADDDQ